MYPYDLFIPATSLFSFFLFLGIHGVIVRRQSSEEVLKSLILSLQGAVVVQIIFFVLFSYFVANIFYQLSLGLKVLGFLLSSLIFFFLVFCYVFFIFGPSETSIRTRILREFKDAPDDRLTLEDLLKRYNDREILKKRLARLMASNELIQKGGRFAINKQVNAFFVIDWLTTQLKRLLSSP